MKPTLIYCYDAYCGWCYGFSEVMKKIHSEYKSTLEFEVLSGGMILPEEPVSIGATAIARRSRPDVAAAETPSG